MNAAIVLSRIHTVDPDATPCGQNKIGQFLLKTSSHKPQLQKALGKNYKINFLCHTADNRQFFAIWDRP